MCGARYAILYSSVAQPVTLSIKRVPDGWQKFKCHQCVIAYIVIDSSMREALAYHDALVLLIYDLMAANIKRSKNFWVFSPSFWGTEMREFKL